VIVVGWLELIFDNDNIAFFVFANQIHLKIPSSFFTL
jgi:hypothetical protein